MLGGPSWTPQNQCHLHRGFSALPLPRHTLLTVEGWIGIDILETGVETMGTEPEESLGHGVAISLTWVRKITSTWVTSTQLRPRNYDTISLTPIWPVTIRPVTSSRIPLRAVTRLHARAHSLGPDPTLLIQQNQSPLLDLVDLLCARILISLPILHLIVNLMILPVLRLTLFMPHPRTSMT